MSSSSNTPESWIASFCSLLGHEYFAEVSEEFIEDDFNLTGLASQVTMYKEALEMILDVEPEDDDDEEEDEEEEDDAEESADGLGPVSATNLSTRPERRQHHNHARMASDLSVIESSAEMLYGLIHQRFICSRAGIQQMSEKYELGHFGCCPRANCEFARTLPVGLSDIPGEDTVKLFCSSCLDVYVPPNSRFQTVDGAFFGRTFGALFLMTFPEYDLTNRAVEALAGGGVGIPGTGIGGSSAVGTASASNELRHATLYRIPDGSPTVNGMFAVNVAPGLGPNKVYEPKIYGFRVSDLARSGPRMQWLRDRPADVNDLDEARRYAEENPDSEDDDNDHGDDDGTAGDDCDDDGDELMTADPALVNGQRARARPPASARQSQNQRRSAQRQGQYADQQRQEVQAVANAASPMAIEHPNGSESEF